MATKAQKETKKTTLTYEVKLPFYDTVLNMDFEVGETYPTEKVTKARLETVRKAGVLKER